MDQFEIEGIENLKERDENERKAIEFIIKEELKENRKIKIASFHAHYDIISIKENDIRYIEVKSWKGIQFQAYFSKSQIDFMKKNKDKYWLYFVYNLVIGKPWILKIKNPIENMRIRNAFRKKMYSLYLDKELKKKYSKDISKGIIK
ncbi:MAG: DUF3883 domain-containing protein [Nitrososphaerota archaeon]